MPTARGARTSFLSSRLSPGWPSTYDSLARAASDVMSKPEMMPAPAEACGGGVAVNWCGSQPSSPCALASPSAPPPHYAHHSLQRGAGGGGVRGVGVRAGGAVVPSPTLSRPSPAHHARCAMPSTPLWALPTMPAA